jgi:hypothetical protein
VIYVDNINIQLQVNTEEINKEPILSIFPNPAEDFIQLSVSHLGGEQIEYRVIDATGRTIVQEKIGNADRIEKRINVESFASGTYQLLLITDEWQKSNTFVVR